MKSIIELLICIIVIILIMYIAYPTQNNELEPEYQSFNSLMRE